MKHKLYGSIALICTIATFAYFFSDSSNAINYHRWEDNSPVGKFQISKHISNYSENSGIKGNVHSLSKTSKALIFNEIEKSKQEFDNWGNFSKGREKSSYSKGHNETVSYASEDVKEIELLPPKERFEKRRNFMHKMCSKINKMKVPIKKDRIKYIEKHRLAVCLVAKMGSSTWRKHLLTLVNQKYRAVRSDRSSRILDTGGTDENYSQLFERSDVISVVNARHPIARLISAYNDKLRYTKFIELQKKYLYKNVKEHITFADFLKTVIRERNDGSLNIHWKSSYKSCSPCDLDYTYIVKIETFNDDVSYIAKKHNLKSIQPSLRKHAVSISSFDDSWKYLKGVPQNVLNDIYFVYEADFHIYGYEVPDIIKKAIWNVSKKRI